MAPLKVLVGTTEVAGMLVDLADGFRRLGHHVTSVVTERHRFYRDAQYDVTLEWTPSSADDHRLPVWSPVARSVRRKARILQLMASHDVFVFMWGGTSLTPGNREYPFLRAMGKRLVSIFVGDDVRYRPLFAAQYPGLPAAFVQEHAGREERADRLKALRAGERWANVIFSQPNQAGLATRPYMHMFVPLNLEQYSFQLQDRDVPVVVHAPSSQISKGSAAILAAFDRLRDEGVRFDLRLLQGADHADVRRALGDADVAVDQLYLPLHGRFGVEAMASGCALASCNRQDVEPYPADRPIWHIDAGTLVERLRQLLTDRPLRMRLAHEGRAYVETHHRHTTVCDGILRLATAPRIDHYDHYPLGARPATSTPPGAAGRTPDRTPPASPR